MVLNYMVVKLLGKVVVNLNLFYVVKVYLNKDLLLVLLKVNLYQLEVVWVYLYKLIKVKYMYYIIMKMIRHYFQEVKMV